MFYISTQGHSASGWLARSFNFHPKIICWHGSKSIPPYNSIEKSEYILNPKEFAKGLIECEKNTNYEKLFGAIHGFHGVSIKKEIEKNNGKFFAIFRHPYNKINSIFSAYYPHNLSNGSIPTDKIRIDYTDFFSKYSKQLNLLCKNFHKKKNDKKKIKKFLKRMNFYKEAKLINKVIIKYKNKFNYKTINHQNSIKNINLYPESKQVEIAFETFLHSCIRTFETDLELIKNCNYNQIIKMEDFTTSKDKFKIIFKKVTGLVISSKNLKIIFNNKDHINKHSVNKDYNKVYESWPEGFKNIIDQYLKNKKLREFYKKLNYNLN